VNPSAQPGDHPVILFDGFCNLCNASVQSVIKRDPQSYFRFASLQSMAARELLKPYFSELDTVDSIVLVTAQGVLVKSDAVLQICRSLRGFPPFLYPLRLFPRSLRDAIYDWIANNRYSWFGRRAVCMIPTPELENRFLL